VVRVLDLSGVTGIFTVYPDADRAAASLAGEPTEEP
jgi:hypothetical protein